MKVRLIYLMLIFSIPDSHGNLLPNPGIAAMGSAGNIYFDSDPSSLMYRTTSKTVWSAYVYAGRPYRLFDQNLLSFGFNRLWNRILCGLQVRLASSAAGNNSALLTCFKLVLPKLCTGFGLGIDRQNLLNYKTYNNYRSSIFGQFNIEKNWSSFAVLDIVSYKDWGDAKSMWATTFGLKFKPGNASSLFLYQSGSSINKTVFGFGMSHNYKDKYEFFGGFSFGRNAFGLAIKKKSSHINFGLAITYNGFLGMGHTLGFEYVK